MLMKKNHQNNQKTAQNNAENEAFENETLSNPTIDGTPQEEPKNAQKTHFDAEKTALTQKIAELTADLQRTRADFENYRKQVENQRENAMKSAREATILTLLPLLDNLNLAFNSYEEQLGPLKKPLEKTLKDLEIAAIDSTPGADFDPDFHEAVMVDDTEGEKEVISETLRPGYTYQNAVIRPAMVKVTRK